MNLTEQSMACCGKMDHSSHRMNPQPMVTIQRNRHRTKRRKEGEDRCCIHKHASRIFPSFKNCVSRRKKKKKRLTASAESLREKAAPALWIPTHCQPNRRPAVNHRLHRIGHHNISGPLKETKSWTAACEPSDRYSNASLPTATNEVKRALDSKARPRNFKAMPVRESPARWCALVSICSVG